MLLEDSPGSTSPVKVKEPHFTVFPEFKNGSYAKRYEILLTRLLRDRLYDAACFLMASKEGGPRGEYTEPCEELSFNQFMQSLLAKAIAVAKTQDPEPASPPVIEYEDEPPPGEPAEGEAAPPPPDEE